MLSPHFTSWAHCELFCSSAREPFVIASQVSVRGQHGRSLLASFSLGQKESWRREVPVYKLSLLLHFILDFFHGRKLVPSAYVQIKNLVFHFEKYGFGLLGSLLQGEVTGRWRAAKSWGSDHLQLSELPALGLWPKLLSAPVWTFLSRNKVWKIRGPPGHPWHAKVATLKLASCQVCCSRHHICSCTHCSWS